jgi:hypothetical protein
MRITAISAAVALMVLTVSTADGAAARRSDRSQVARFAPGGPRRAGGGQSRRRAMTRWRARWQSIRATARRSSSSPRSRGHAGCRARRSASTARRWRSSPTTRCALRGQGEAMVAKGATGEGQGESRQDQDDLRRRMRRRDRARRVDRQGAAGDRDCAGRTATPVPAKPAACPIAWDSSVLISAQPDR